MKNVNDSLDRSFISSYVLQHLRRRLILGEIKAGEKVVEAQIAEELSFSRGPVRNALFVLEKEGLIRFLSNGRTEAVGFELKDMEKLYDTRLYLESYAVEMASGHQASRYLRLQNIMGTMKTEINNVEKFTSLDLEFHYELMQLSDNKFLVQCWQTIRPLIETILLITNAHIRETDDWNKGYVLELHDKINGALMNSDSQESVTFIREHLLSGKSVMMDKMKNIILLNQAAIQ